ncbi:MAG: 1-acyl-sn-glycerol-3-phosphate acyltransferase [Deltaproteobacteria bacterium]|jgi:1-acyl-sn-glycerol-3-phosphate acyltransferase|nr:1-acyl-sn-glycerol-3-phosphate acyltransferase [Deltaproteobacteria bacterium]
MRSFFFGLWYWPVFFILTVTAGFICLTASLFSKNISRFITSRVWAFIVLDPAFIKVETYGRENLPPGGGFIVFANHRSILDIPAVARATGRSISWVAKAALGRIPVFGWTLKRVHLLVDRGGGPEAAKQMVAEASRRLAGGEIMAIFPEGTRNKSAVPVLPFKKGAFILAKHTGAPLIPLAILNSGSLWPSGRYLPCSGRIKAAIGAPLTVDPKESLAALAKKAEKILESLYLSLEKAPAGPEPSSDRLSAPESGGTPDCPPDRSSAPQADDPEKTLAAGRKQ